MNLLVRRFADLVSMPIALEGKWATVKLIYCVSDELRRRLQQDRLSDADLEAPIQGFTALCEAIDESQVEPLTASYHGPKHARAVARRFRRVIKAAGGSETSQQLATLAGLLHDAGHPGKRYREEREGVQHPELSNEEYAGALAVQLLAGHLNTTQLAWIYSAILATSFGQRVGRDPAVNAVLAAKPHLERPYLPVSPHEVLLHFADVNALLDEQGVDEYMSGGLALAREMSEVSKLDWQLEDLTRFVSGQQGFLEYIAFQAAAVKPMLVEVEFHEEMMSTIDEARRTLKTMKNMLSLIKSE